MRPSSSAITMPNSSGSGTRVRPTVTSAPFSLWNLVISVRSMSVSASPDMTRNVSSFRASSAFLTEPAVPGGEELDGDDRLLHPVPLQQPEHVLHDRPVHHRQQRLGLVGGHRAEPGALAACHHDGLHEAWAPFTRSLI